jgi:predicted MPP superfamily phosphohydrolase
LSGHTHGGQILGMDALVARFNQGYLHGWYSVGPMAMYVSSGAGLWNGFPVRLGVPSEIVCLTLRSA